MRINLYGDIGYDVTLDEIAAKISAADSIELHIHSPGGSVYDGWAIANLIRTSGKKSTAIIEGLCASIATHIALSCDTVKAVSPSMFMIHNPWVGVEGESTDLKSAADVLDKIKLDILKIYTKKTKKSEIELSTMMDRETWLSAEEAVELGFIDEITAGLKAVAKINNMDINKLKIIFDKVKNILPKNMNVTTTEGVTLYVQTEDEVIEGKPVFIADEEGNPTETVAPDGEHTLTDGTVITVEGGIIVTAVAPASTEEPSEVDALKAEIEALKAQLADKDEKEAEMKNTISVQDSKIDALAKAMNEIKLMTAGKPFTPAKAVTQPANKGEEAPKPKNDLSEWGRMIAKKNNII